MRPRVSVIIPSYNRARLLPETLDCVLSQTVSEIECIVVDDGSSDGTRELLFEYQARDTRVRYVEQLHKGPSAARNLGIRESRGQYIQFLDSDDIILPDKLQKQLAQLAGTGKLALAYCDYRYCAHDDVRKDAARDSFPPPRFLMERPLWDIAARWEAGFTIPMHCFLFDARIFREHQIFFDEKLANHEDWDCWMQVFALDPQIFHIAEVLAVYRLHDASICADRHKLLAGFEKALRKQRRIFRRDAVMRGILQSRMNELKTNPHRPARSTEAARKRLVQIYRRTTPWPLQSLVSRLSRWIS